MQNNSVYLAGGKPESAVAPPVNSSAPAEFVGYEHRFKYNDETSSIKGWSAWEPCKSQADFKDLCVYISWGKPYQLRRIYAIPVDDAQISAIANGATVRP